MLCAPGHCPDQRRRNEEFAIDFTYDMKKLLLPVVMLVNLLILTLITINMNLL